MAGFGIKGKEFGFNLLRILTDLTGMPDRGAGRVCGGISTSASLNGGAFWRWTRALVMEVRVW